MAHSLKTCSSHRPSWGRDSSAHSSDTAGVDCLCHDWRGKCQGVSAPREAEGTDPRRGIPALHQLVKEYCPVNGHTEECKSASTGWPPAVIHSAVPHSTSQTSEGDTSATKQNAAQTQPCSSLPPELPIPCLPPWAPTLSYPSASRPARGCALSRQWSTRRPDLTLP